MKLIIADPRIVWFLFTLSASNIDAHHPALDCLVSLILLVRESSIRNRRSINPVFSQSHHGSRRKVVPARRPRIKHKFWANDDEYRTNIIFTQCKSRKEAGGGTPIIIGDFSGELGAIRLRNGADGTKRLTRCARASSTYDLATFQGEGRGRAREMAR